MEARLAALEDRLRQTEEVLVAERLARQKAGSSASGGTNGTQRTCVLSTREQSENLLRSVVTLIRTVSPKECLGHSGASSSAVTV